MGPRTAAVVALATVVALLATERASACSCAGEPGPLSFESWDAAVNARLLEVERVGSRRSGRAVFVYGIRRVFKGRQEYGLRVGERLRIRGFLSEATCGLPRRRQRLYGLLLYEWRERLQANLCTVRSPGELRDAAERRRQRSTRRGRRVDRSAGEVAPYDAVGQVLRSRSAASARWREAMSSWRCAFSLTSPLRSS